jgi:hypothetical protein
VIYILTDEKEGIPESLVLKLTLIPLIGRRILVKWIRYSCVVWKTR